MNLALLFSLILTTFFGITCASNGTLHDTPNALIQKVFSKQNNVSPRAIVPRKEAPSNKPEGSVDKHLPPNDRVSTTQTKDNETKQNTVSETKTSLTDSTDVESDKYSPSETKSSKISTSSEITSAQNKTSNQSNSLNSSKTTDKSSELSSVSTESTSSSKSSSKPKPSITYSVEDMPDYIPKTRQHISPQTPFDGKSDADNPVLPPPSIFDTDQMEKNRDIYIFPIIVLIFLVPMVLGVGIIILRRVRDYWSTRHYRRMDFLVDGMYNT